MFKIGILNIQRHKNYAFCFFAMQMYSDGVSPVKCLKAVINVVRDLNPT